MMPHSEIPSSSPFSQENIPGFEGYKMMKEKVDVLKQGAFAQFMQKVLEYRSNPSKMEALKKEFSGYEKKRDIAALRAGGLSNDPIEGPARLFALFGDEVNFEADGMRIKFDFHGMDVAKGCVGAGHLLPGSVARVQNKSGAYFERRPGLRGPEYRNSKDRRYQPIYTNTEIFVPYSDIFPDSVDDLRERARIEGQFIEQRAQVRDETQKRLAESVPAVRPSASPAGPAAPGVPVLLSPRASLTASPKKIESHEVYHPSDVLVFGDSQIGGIRGYLTRGVRSYHLNGASISHVFGIIRDHQKQVKTAKLIYVQAGGNDVWSANPEKMKRDMQALIAYVRDVNPSVRLVIGTIPPREEVIAQKSSARVEKIRHCLNAYNEWVRSGFEVFDVNQIMASVPGSSYQNPAFRRKGAPNVHFNAAGYKTYAQAFEKQFNIGIDKTSSNS